ncbi:hypothetical protein DSO57_1013148 [Entomophthora muscae]|uniref:Uncharacterized protein n=1 Tax=Entomophthora muscae TaxID=34485 RepID=A0ACC2TGX6_9FUNG|nr:hypothetical protein DSO57_1013148 [Entomophthora muscae]
MANCPDPRQIPRPNPELEPTMDKKTSYSTGSPNHTQINNIQTPGNSSLPFIWIVIHGPVSNIKTFALLDTGADVNYIDSRLAKALKLTPGPKIDACGPNNLPVTAFKIKPLILFHFLNIKAFYFNLIGRKWGTPHGLAQPSHSVPSGEVCLPLPVYQLKVTKLPCLPWHELM